MIDWIRQGLSKAPRVVRRIVNLDRGSGSGLFIEPAHDVDLPVQRCGRHLLACLWHRLQSLPSLSATLTHERDGEQGDEGSGQRIFGIIVIN